MNEYIFYTTEGHTTSPNNNNVENCQMLGRAYGKNIDEAQDNLLKENPWIIGTGFDKSFFTIKQLLTNEQRIAIKEVLDYLWDDEMKHFEECTDKETHIFKTLQILKNI